MSKQVNRKCPLRNMIRPIQLSPIHRPYPLQLPTSLAGYVHLRRAAANTDPMRQVTLRTCETPSSSSSCSMPLQERRRFHDITPQITVVSSMPGRPQSQVLMFEVILDSAYIAMFDEGDHEVVSTHSAGH